MKLGAGTVTWAFNGESLETALQEIASTGIRYVDIIGMLHGDPENLTQDIKTACKKIIQEKGLKVSSILAVKPGINIATNNKALQNQSKQYIQQIIDLCHFFDASEICLMAGHHEFESDAQTNWNRAVDFSHWICEQCLDTGLYVTYELEWRTCGIVQSIREMFQMIQDVNCPNLYANIDVGHAGLARDSLTDMETIGERTIHLHMNDNDTVIHVNALPGEGAVPIRDYVQSLIKGGMLTHAKAMDYTVIAGIEVEDVTDSGQPSVSLIKQSRDWILENISSIQL
ncbi:sugar phosphate isomerase/epimerase family protein [Planctomycetota bacterium]